MENFWEEIVVRKHKGAYEALYIFSVILMILFAAVALYGFNLFFRVLTSGSGIHAIILTLVGVLVCGLAAFALFNGRNYLRMEYEYTFTNGEMDFARVLNNTKRTQYPSFNLRMIEYMGRVGDEQFDRYMSEAQEKLHLILNRDTEKYYIYIALEKGARTLIVFEPSQTLVDMIRQYAPQKVNV